MLTSWVRHVIHEVGDGPAALETIQAIAPDVMILDPGLEVLSGPEVMQSFAPRTSLQTKFASHYDHRRGFVLPDRGLGWIGRP